MKALMLDGNTLHDGGDSVEYSDRVAGKDDDNDVSMGGHAMWG